MADTDNPRFRDVAGNQFDLDDVVSKVADASPLLVQHSYGGATLTAGSALDVIAATPGRVKALVQHTGTAGRVWIRFDGGDAVIGSGEFIDPGQQWWEFTAAAVSALYEGTGTCRVATSELAAA